MPYDINWMHLHVLTTLSVIHVPHVHVCKINMHTIKVETLEATSTESCTCTCIS